jgi:preprotein translocase subunit SecG
MTTLPLAAVSFIMNLIVLVWVFVSLALILIILIQKGRGGGLSSAFGGAGANSLLGTKTTDWLTKVTIGTVLVFLLLAVLMNKYYKPKLSEELQESANVTDVIPPAQPDQTTPQPETPPLPENPTE